MRIATIMSIAVLGLSGAAIAQVATPPDQEVPPPQNEMMNNMTAPGDAMPDDMMNGHDDMDTTMPDTVPDPDADMNDPNTPPTAPDPAAPAPDVTETAPSTT